MRLTKPLRNVIKEQHLTRRVTDHKYVHGVYESLIDSNRPTPEMVREKYLKQYGEKLVNDPQA